MADDKNKPGNADDKNINELLSEYADLKDEDLQDFLKDTDSEDSFVLDDEEQAAAATQERRKSSIMPLVMSVVILGAAAGGAYYFVTQKGGVDAAMQSIRAAVPGMGGDEPVSAPMMAYDEPGTTTPTPANDLPAPGPDTAATDPSLPPSADTGVAQWPEAPTAAPAGEQLTTQSPVTGDMAMPEPLPIVNEAATPTATPADASPLAAVPPVPADPALPDTVTAATPVPASEEETAATAPAPAAAEPPVATPAEITSWERAADQPAPPADEPAPIAAAIPATPAEPVPATMPEKNVAALKATPPGASAEEPKAKKPAKQASSSGSSKAKAKAASTDPLDGALPPPYLAIRSGQKPVAGTAGAGADQGTVYVSSAGVSSNGDTPLPIRPDTVEPVTENANHSQPDLNNANPYYDVIRQGGGMVEMVNGKVVAAGSAQAAPAAPQQAAAPRAAAPAGRINVPTSPSAPGYDAVANAGSQLVASGGRSYPVKDGASLAAMSQPTASELAARKQANTVPLDGSAPEAAMPAPAAPAKAAPAPVRAQQPATQAPAPQAAAAAPQGATSAPAVLQQAMQAEKAGKAAEAVGLYQKALEVDAVLGGGTSIDRGMVYDRIAALRSK